MDKAFGLLGRSLLVAGVIPALVWLLLNLVFLVRPELGTQLPDLLLSGPLKPEAIALLLSLATAAGTLLTALNGAITRLYEGALPWQRPLLGWSRRRFERRHDRLYRRLLELREMREQAVRRRDGARAEQAPDLDRRAASGAVALDEEHSAIEALSPDRVLPFSRALLKPTALGNAYAALEAYPHERYGMDSMVFWPRLIAVVPSDYREAIGTQKTTCDFLLHLSFLFLVFALELVLVVGLDVLGAGQTRPVLLLILPLSLLLWRVLYVAAVAETVVFGKVVNGAFDLYRRDLLERFGVAMPADVAEERDVWRALAAFIRRGEDFYHPTRAPAPTPAPERTQRLGQEAVDTVDRHAGDRTTLPDTTAPSDTVRPQ